MGCRYTANGRVAQCTVYESVTDTVDVETDSETDEELQTVPAAEVKSVPLLARPSDDTEDPGDTPNNENNDSPVVVFGT